jgi:membrane associated rhomboid family serine protease
MGRPLSRSFTVLGHRMPFVVAAISGLTLIMTLLARNSQVVFESTVLLPERVWTGELWRLVTWVFVVPDPLGLLFGVLAMVLWFGPDLVGAWGPRRFLSVYLGLAAATAVVTCLIARLLSPRLLGAVYAGWWPMIDALIIAWALIFPFRDLYLFFVLPLRGQNLVYGTIGITLLFAMLPFNLVGFLPHFVAEGLMLASVRWSPRDLWLRLRYRFLTRKLWSPPSHLRPVQRHRREDEPPRWLH